MHNKLQGIISPSSSKPGDDDEYYEEAEEGEIYHVNQEKESQSDDVSTASIPMAHKEYEKILR